MKTDNGSPFQSHEFRRYCESMGIRHRKITPYWPRANAEAERFMKTLNKFIRASVADRHDWGKDLNKFLCNYRATPHSTTNVAPAECMFSRNIRTKLPEVPIYHDDDDMQFRDMMAKARMKSNAKSSAVTPHTLHIADNVLLN